MNFYFVGDSITVGQYVSIEKTWVAMVSEILNKKLGDKYVFMNTSISGNTTRDALQRIHDQVLHRKPDIVYIQFGMNDCNVWGTSKGESRVSKIAFRSNLNELISNMKAFGVELVILGTNHPANKAPKYNKDSETYNKVIREFENSVLIVDHEKFWEDKHIDHSYYLMEDGIHLNERGHVLYRDCFIENVIQWL